MRHLPERCENCRREIPTKETCVLGDGTAKRAADVTFRESVEGGVRCVECAGAWSTTVPMVAGGRVVAEIPCEVERLGRR